MTRSILMSVLLCTAMLAAGCNRDAGAVAERPAGEAAEKAGGIAEKISENVYRNRTFGLTVTAPDGWFVMDNDQTERVMEVGVDVATAGNEKLKAVAEASKQATSNIFMMFRHPPGTPVEFNPSVLSVAESLAMAPGVQTGKDYFFHARRLLEQSSMAPEVIGEYSTKTIDGQVFDTMDIRLDTNGVVISQRFFAARHDNHIIMIVQSYQDEAQEKETAAVLDSIQLDW